MEIITLGQLEKLLNQGGFDTALDDNVLQASKEEGESSFEITIDSGGGCLVKKTTIESSNSKSMRLFMQEQKVLTRKQKIAEFRTYVGSVEDLKEVLNTIDKL